MKAPITVVSLLAGLTLSSQSNADTVTWEVVNGGNGNTYTSVVVPGGVTWYEARDLAVAMGGHLASITSAEENQFVFDNLSSDADLWHAGADYHVGPWLGGYQDSSDPTYSEPSGGWKWVTGEAFTFRPPLWTNNLYGSGVADENALHLINDFGFTPADQWNDYPAATFPDPSRPGPIAFIVESPPVVPTPSAVAGGFALLGLAALRRRQSATP